MDSVSGVFVPAEVLAQEQGVPVDDVIERIRAGLLTGRQHGEDWQVLVRIPPQETSAAAPATAPATPMGPVTAEFAGPVTLAGSPEVIVRDVHIGLGSMVGLILKFVVALAIAGVILGGLGMAIWLLVESYGAGMVDAALDLLGPMLPR